MLVVMLVFNLLVNSLQTITVTETQRSEIRSNADFIIIDDEVM
jgi:hypothetical protein